MGEIGTSLTLHDVFLLPKEHTWIFTYYGVTHFWALWSGGKNGDKTWVKIAGICFQVGQSRKKQFLTAVEELLRMFQKNCIMINGIKGNIKSSTSLKWSKFKLNSVYFNMYGLTLHFSLPAGRTKNVIVVYASLCSHSVRA